MKKLSFYTLIMAGVLAAGVSACTTGPYPVHHSHYHPHDYYYYPTIGIYFRYSTGYYYYPSGSIWIKTRKLPPKYRLDPHDRIVIRIDNDKPYTKHHQHRERYRPRPDYHPDPYRDEKERFYNKRRYEDYQRKR